VWWLVQVGTTPPVTAFDTLVGSIDYPMLVVTTRSATGENSGCLVGFATQCSIDPAHFLVCLSKKNHTYETAKRADLLVVHVLRDADKEVARQFGEETGDAVDKFAAVDWTPGPGRVPILSGIDWFAGRIQQRFDCGDHVAHLLAVLPDGRATNADAEQLGYSSAQDLDAAHDA
jgi:flavin reductase (DIM6/NTAB) family NADH-FMN oxidoreductase RutF